jgi:hypothetical protein
MSVNKKFNFSPDSKSVEDLENVKSKSLIKYEEKNFWDKFLDMLPTPEEEIENMIKDEERLEELIKETKEGLEKIEESINSSDLIKDDLTELENMKAHYTSLLETFESELQCTKVQHKSMNTILNSEDSNDEFENNIPELLANSIVSTRKKMEDVNDVVKSVEKIAKKNRIEECIYCFTILKDEYGRKTSLKHVHINNNSVNTFKKYKPVICIDCINKYCDLEEIPKEFKNCDNFEKLDSENLESTCKKGSKIYSYELKGEFSSDFPMFNEKIKKYMELEKNEFINKVKSEEKKSFFGLNF